MTSFNPSPFTSYTRICAAEGAKTNGCRRHNGSPESEAGAAGGRASYVVRPGDTLAGIAGKVYGDKSKYRRIQEANNLKDARSIKVGQALVIP